MYRSLGFIAGILLAGTTAVGQITPTQSQSLQALVSEIHQLRQELRTSTVVAQRTQIILYRLQAQDSALARARRRLDDAQSRLNDAEASQREATAQIERNEGLLSRTQNPAEKEGMEQVLAHFKAVLQKSTSEVTQRQARQTDAESQLQAEQAKAAALQELLNRIDKSLESSAESQPELTHR